MHMFPVQELAGYKLETMYTGVLVWTIDASLFTNLRVLHLKYQFQVAENLRTFSLHQWMQLLRCLNHFSTAPVQYIDLELLVNYWQSDDPRVSHMLEEFSWSDASALLQRFGNLRQFHMKLRCPSAEPFETQHSVTTTYLELISKGLASLKSKGKLRIDWIYHEFYDNDTKRRRVVFTLP